LSLALDSVLSGGRKGAKFVKVRATFVRGGYWGSAQSGGKEFADVYLDSFYSQDWMETDSFPEYW